MSLKIISMIYTLHNPIHWIVCMLNLIDLKFNVVNIFWTFKMTEIKKSPNRFRNQ